VLEAGHDEFEVIVFAFRSGHGGWKPVSAVLYCTEGKEKTIMSGVVLHRGEREDSLNMSLEDGHLISPDVLMMRK
jgi:hypothetical protein